MSFTPPPGSPPSGDQPRSELLATPLPSSLSRASTTSPPHFSVKDNDAAPKDLAQKTENVRSNIPSPQSSPVRAALNRFKTGIRKKWMEANLAMTKINSNSKTASATSASNTKEMSNTEGKENDMLSEDKSTKENGQAKEMSTKEESLNTKENSKEEEPNDGPRCPRCNAVGYIGACYVCGDGNGFNIRD